MTALLTHEAPVKDSVTQYVIRRKADGWCYVAQGVWSAREDRAERFDFLTTATAALLFDLDDDPDRFSIDAVQGER